MTRLSFQTGLRLDLTTRVFRLRGEDFDSGKSLTLTYGSENPLGSIGIKFFASLISQTRIDVDEVEGFVGVNPGSDPPWEDWIERWILSLPRLSWWSHPQRSGTFTWHFLWTFMSQALHFSPCWNNPYRIDPHWSQNVGLVYVFSAKWCCLTPCPPPLPLSSPWQEKLT